jgi:hypothetical protein
MQIDEARAFGIPRMGVIKPRFSKTVGEKYVSQGCARWDALVGEFPLREDFITVSSEGGIFGNRDFKFKMRPHWPPKGLPALAEESRRRRISQRLQCLVEDALTEGNEQIDQGEFTGRFCGRPHNFAWFLGAGASATAGLPTATDILWDLKRKYYCREENRDIGRQDLQNCAVRATIQGYMESHGFPELWADDEYPTYFEKIFGDDKERQRRYMKAVLAEKQATLAVGNRVMGALLAAGFCRIVFTTNFDSIVERAVAEVGGRSLSAYHLEGSHMANEAVNNEEFPIYCKLHGDFRYDSLKNLPGDVATQNHALSQALRNAGNRFGFVISGYSGRDRSIIELFRSVLKESNPFPHGFYWTGLKGSTLRREVADFLAKARAKGVAAHFVPIETFDALMLRLWRNIPNRPEAMDAKVRKSRSTSVQIPLPRAGK